MLKNIITLTSNDLAIAFKNKSLFLILFIPFFVFMSMKLVDMSNTDFKKVTICFVEHGMYSPVIRQSVASADKLFTVTIAANEEEGRKWLKDKKIDGLLLAATTDKNSLELVVVKKETLVTLAIVERISALQQAVEGSRVNWISTVKPLQEQGIQQQTLPTWILMLVLLVSFIIIPAQVAEEKEKELLLALLQTPMREIEWLMAKLLLGMTLIIIAVLFLHLLGQFDFGNGASYLVFIVVGSFCFSSYGVFLGFLCRNQASARTLGVIFYLPHLLPSALADYSKKLTVVAPFLPSYQLYEPVKSILLEGGNISDLSLEWLYLLAVGLLTFSSAYLLLKRRWLM